MSAHFFPDHVDYGHRVLSNEEADFELENLTWEDSPSVFSDWIIIFFLICIHVFLMRHFFTMFSKQIINSLWWCVFWFMLFHLQAHNISTKAIYPAAYMSLGSLHPHRSLSTDEALRPPSFHEHLRTNLAWFPLHSLGPSAHKVLLLHQRLLLLPAASKSPECSCLTLSLHCPTLSSWHLFPQTHSQWPLPSTLSHMD